MISTSKFTQSTFNRQCVGRREDWAESGVWKTYQTWYNIEVLLTLVSLHHIDGCPHKYCSSKVRRSIALSVSYPTQSELESCMIKLPLSAFGFTINDKTFGFQLFHVSTFSAFSFLLTKFFGFWLLALGFRLAFQLLLSFFSSKIEKNREEAKSWRKIKLLAFRFYHQHFFFSFLLSAFYIRNSSTFGF